MPKEPIIFCELSAERSDRIVKYAEALKEIAPMVGEHGLSEREFWESGIFGSAIERLRGQRSAATTVKHSFVGAILESVRNAGLITYWEFSGAGERHDYEVCFPSGRIAIVETKGCLDGNNTNIFQRPPQADEFIIWSLCQNPGADPRHNCWSGIHTRLGANMIHRNERIDGVVIWDMLCGTAARPCPKLTKDATRATSLGSYDSIPPPCIYLFPRSIPDPRNNPNPPVTKLKDVELFTALHQSFHGDAADVVEVRIEARMLETQLQRRTRFFRQGKDIRQSYWTSLKRANS